MPVCLDPNTSNDFVLKGDREKESPPTFFIKVLTLTEKTKLVAEYEKVDDHDLASDRLKAVSSIADLLISGWINMGKYEYGKDRLADFLTFDEYIELVDGALIDSEPTHEELKN